MCTAQEMFFLCRIFIFAFLISFNALAAPFDECEKILTDPEEKAQFISEVFDGVLKDTAFPTRIFLSLKEKKLKQAVLQECNAQGLCTQTDITKAVKQAIENRQPLNHLLQHKRAYLVTLTTWTGGVILASQLGGDYLSFLIGCAVAILGSPILEQASSKLRHFMFYPHGRTQGQMESAFGAQWVNTQGAFSINAQMSRNLHLEALQLIQQYLPPGLIVILRENPKLAEDLIATKLLELAKIFREHLEDVSYQNPQIARAIYLAIIQYLEDPEAWLEQILSKKIPGLDPEKEILTFWLKQKF